MEATYLKYRPAWRGFYLSFLAIIALIVIALYVQSSIPDHQKLLWYSVAVVDVLIFISIAIRRFATKLEIHDNPAKKEEQEVEYSECHLFNPSNFQSSIQISFNQIVDIAIRKSIIQTILRTGDIVVTSSGTGREEIVAKSIPDPERVREEIQKRAGKYPK